MPTANVQQLKEKTAALQQQLAEKGEGADETELRSLKKKIRRLQRKRRRLETAEQKVAAAQPEPAAPAAAAPAETKDKTEQAAAEPADEDRQEA